MKKALCREDPEGGLLRRWGALLCVRRGILPHEAEWKDSLIHFAGGALFCAFIADLWRRRSNASRNMPAAISQSSALASLSDSGIALPGNRSGASPPASALIPGAVASAAVQARRMAASPQCVAFHRAGNCRTVERKLNLRRRPALSRFSVKEY